MHGATHKTERIDEFIKVTISSNAAQADSAQNPDC